MRHGTFKILTPNQSDTDTDSVYLRHEIHDLPNLPDIDTECSQIRHEICVEVGLYIDWISLDSHILFNVRLIFKKLFLMQILKEQLHVCLDESLHGDTASVMHYHSEEVRHP